jgi:hypothetical protein
VFSLLSSSSSSLLTVFLCIELNTKNNAFQQTVTIYDLKNKFIAFKFSNDKMQVSHILQEWGSLFILATESTDSGMQQTMHLLEEKDTQTKLEMLFQKNLYTIAISLVNSQQIDYTYVVEIFRKYGDHLYQKKDYDTAMQQYLRTIGKLEPSYVIRKFLDAQRIGNLTTYLEALHEKNLATSDHTTLLLNCYTKLKEKKKDKLDKFISEHANLHCDVETAIKVCRTSGYKEHALLLAREHGEHDWFLKITVEDFPEDQLGTNYLRALRHIESLSFADAEKYMQIYGKILVTKLPKHSTNVLIRLCTDYFTVLPHITNRTLYGAIGQTKKEIQKQEKTISERLSQIAADKKSGDRFGLDFFGFGSKKQSTTTDSGSSNALTSTPEDSAGNKSSAENFIHAFSSQPYWLMVFLENVILRNTGNAESISTTVYNTLIELYLQYLERDREEVELMNNTSTERMSHLGSSGVLESMHDFPQDYVYDIIPPNDDYASLSYKGRCLELMDNSNSHIDTEHVLVLVQSANFKEGVLKMYERLELHYDIIQYYMDRNDYENVISSCMKYGHLDTNLWVQVLNYFANHEHDKESDIEFDEYISRVLQKIEKDSLLPPLLVVQILSKKNSKTKLNTIREFLCTKVAQEQILMKEDEEKIREFQTDTRNKKKEVFTLRTSAKIFQLTSCSYCSQQLDLPAVHFMCGHSYHQRCCSTNIEIDDTESCPKCHRANMEILQRKQKYEESSDQHDVFFKQLNKNTDGFSVVAEYLGRNMFSMIQMDPDDLMSEGDLYSDEDEDGDDYEDDEDYTEEDEDSSGRRRSRY